MRNLFKRLADSAGILLELACIAAIVAGVALIYVPAGFIVGGVLGVAAMQAYARSQAASPEELEIARRLRNLARQRAA